PFTITFPNDSGVTKSFNLNKGDTVMSLTPAVKADTTVLVTNTTTNTILSSPSDYTIAGDVITLKTAVSAFTQFSVSYTSAGTEVANDGSGAFPPNQTAVLKNGKDSVQATATAVFAGDNNDLLFTVLPTATDGTTTFVGKASDGIKINFKSAST